jgi:prevent-host-death family protein
MYRIGNINIRAINITELRAHLPKYLSNAQKGTEILVTSHGHVIARILPPIDPQIEAQKKLKELRKHCKVNDVISPIAEDWDAEK